MSIGIEFFGVCKGGGTVDRKYLGYIDMTVKTIVM